MRVVAHVAGRLGWLNLVDVLCAGDEVARGKPSPEIFLLAAQRLGVPPEHCLVLEDSVNGALAAQAAGMRCLAVPHAPHVADDFKMIADLIAPSLHSVDLEAIFFSHQTG